MVRESSVDAETEWSNSTACLVADTLHLTIYEFLNGLACCHNYPSLIIFSTSLSSFYSHYYYFGGTHLRFKPNSITPLSRLFSGFLVETKDSGVHTERKRRGSVFQSAWAHVISSGTLKCKTRKVVGTTVLWDFCLSGPARSSGSHRRAGTQGVPRAGQRSRLRSKARGAGHAPRTQEQCLGPRA